MARDLSVQAILTANTTPFANGMKQASESARKFSADMKRFRQQINQPLFVPRPGQKQTPEMVLFGGTISEGLAAQKFRQIQKSERLALHARQEAITAERKQHSDRFNMIRQSEERALKLRQFYARKEIELEATRSRFRLSGGAIKKGIGGAVLGAGIAAQAFSSDSVTGQSLSSVANIGGAAALGFMSGGPIGAAIFGGVTALTEFKGALDRASESVKQAQQWASQQVVSAMGRRQQVVDEVRELREQVFSEGTLTEAGAREVARRQITEKIQAQEKLIELADRGGGGFSSAHAKGLRRQRSAMLSELQAFDFRASGLAGLQALFQSRGAIADTALQFGQQGLDFLGAGVRGFRENVFEHTRQQRLSSREALIARTMALQSTANAGIVGAPLAIRGSNEFLRQIHDQPKVETKLEDLVRIAKQQLDEERQQAEDIGREIARQRITVRM